jgi:hypothetical protein
MLTFDFSTLIDHDPQKGRGGAPSSGVMLSREFIGGAEKGTKGFVDHESANELFRSLYSPAFPVSPSKVRWEMRAEFAWKKGAAFHYVSETKWVIDESRKSCKVLYH